MSNDNDIHEHISKLSFKSGDICLVQSNNAEERALLIRKLQVYDKLMPLRIPIVVTTTDVKIRDLDEKIMNYHGWYKKK